MKLFRRGDAHDAAAAPAAPAAAEPKPFARGFIPEWFKRAGVASWYLIGIVIVLTGLAYALHLLAALIVPTLFAVLLGATFMPAVDWLERHHVGRTWGALIMTVLIVVGAFALLALMTVGVIDQWSTIETQVQAAVDWINETLQRLEIDPGLIDSARQTPHGQRRQLGAGRLRRRDPGHQHAGDLRLRRLHRPQHPRLRAHRRAAHRPLGLRSTWARCRRRWATRSSPTARGSCAATSGAARSSASSTGPWSLSARSSSACRWRSRSSWSSGSPTTSRCSAPSSAARSRCSSRWGRAGSRTRSGC